MSRESMMRKLGLTAEDFESKPKPKPGQQELSDTEAALCELAEMVAAQEEAILELAEMIGGVLDG